MQSVVTTTTTTSTSTSTTTTTTTAATKTINYSGDNGGCVGMSVRFIKNGVTQCVGASCFGSFTAVVGDTITAENTTGPKATGFCTEAFACIGSSDGGCEYGSDANSGAGVTASVTITITSAYPSVIYMNAGLAI